MKFSYPLALLLCSVGSIVGAMPAPTPAPTPGVTARAAAPAPTDVSIAPVSIPSITPPSIPPVSIASVSLDLPTSTCSMTIKPDKNGYVPPGSCGALWNYSPSYGAAIVFTILFTLLTVAHIGQAIVHKTGYCWVIAMAGSWELGSYATRAAGAHNQQSSILATISQILVLLAPIWVNAFAYMVFARIVHFFSPTKKVWKISPSILAFCFVTLDIASFIIQLIGGGMAAPGNDPQSMLKGLHIYMGGIGLQEAFIVLFTGLVIKFHIDQIKAERVGQLSGAKLRWRWVLYALYTCLGFITLRIIYRLIEFSKGMDTNNPLPYKESYFYGLEAWPMFMAILVWNVFHPGRFMQGPDAKLPPSWLSRKICCCCHRKSKRAAHQRLHSQAGDSTEELKALRSRDVSVTEQNEYYDNAPPFRQPQPAQSAYYDPPHQQYQQLHPESGQYAPYHSRSRSASPPNPPAYSNPQYNIPRRGIGSE